MGLGNFMSASRLLITFLFSWLVYILPFFHTKGANSNNFYIIFISTCTLLFMKIYEGGCSLNSSIVTKMHEVSHITDTNRHVGMSAPSNLEHAYAHHSWSGLSAQLTAKCAGASAPGKQMHSLLQPNSSARQRVKREGPSKWSESAPFAPSLAELLGWDQSACMLQQLGCAFTLFAQLAKVHSDESSLLLLHALGNGGLNVASLQDKPCLPFIIYICC